MTDAAAAAVMPRLLTRHFLSSRLVYVVFPPFGRVALEHIYQNSAWKLLFSLVKAGGEEREMDVYDIVSRNS